METELELTYLAKSLSLPLAEAPRQRIIDVYVPDGPTHSHLRLRQKGDAYMITKKQPVVAGDASVQTEETIQLTRAEWEALVTCSKKRVEKDRYAVEIEGHPAEIDIFRGKLAGLVLIDFEFKTIDEKTAFQMPAVALADVTNEEFIAGGMLAGKSYEDIAMELAGFGYRKIEN